MSLLDTLRTSLLNFIMPALGDDTDRLMREQVYGMLRSYAAGAQKRNLRVKPDQADDNLTINLLGVVIDRGISMLFGRPIDFDFGDGAQAAADYIARVTDANNYPIFLHKLAQLGGTYGTCYVKIVPDALDYAGGTLPRLIPINSKYVMIDSLPDDIDTVYRYTVQYNTVDENGKDLAVKEVTEHLMLADGSFAEAWSVKLYHMREREAQWQLVSDVTWPYSFAPIVHWQNLPDAEDSYGESDITMDMIELQNAINFIASNIQRIIRYHAHPKTWGKGFSTTGATSWGADELVTVNGADAMIANLEMQSDLASSREYLHYLRGVLFDISRTVDLSVMQDKLGSLTNFGLRVLYKDALDKLETKRLLYGWGLEEINHRLLELAGIAPSEGGEVVWQDNLPVDELNQAQAAQVKLGMGIVDKETLSQEFGYDWSIIDERLANEQQTSNNIGDQILRNFEQGQTQLNNAR